MLITQKSGVVGAPSGKILSPGQRLSLFACQRHLASDKIKKKNKQIRQKPADNTANVKMK